MSKINRQNDSLSDSAALPPIEEILRYHIAVIEKYGGCPGRFYNTEERLESILSQLYYGRVRYRTISSLAAYLIYLINKGHIFIDGNKRVSIGAGLTFLRINGYSLEADEEALANLALRIAGSDAKKMKSVIKNTADWIRKRLIILE